MGWTDRQGIRPRTGCVGIAVLAALAMAGCGGEPSPPRLPATGSTSITTTEAAAATTVVGTGAGTTTSSTAPRSASAAGQVLPYQAAPATTPCRLTATSLDLQAVEVETRERRVPYVPPPDAIPSPVLPGPVSSLNVLGRWFRVGSTAIVRLDPATAAPDAALTSGPCRIVHADADDEIAAALVCEQVSDAGADDRTGCSISVAAVGDGSAVGAWTVERPNTVVAVSVDDSRVVVARAPALPDDPDGPGRSQALVVIDPRTGAGTTLDPTPCVTGGAVAGAIPRTSLALVSCDGTVAVDARTGTTAFRFAANRDALQFWPPASDGSTILLSDGSRRRIDTFQELAEPAAVPTPATGAWFGYPRVVTEQGVWQVEPLPGPQVTTPVPGPPLIGASEWLQPADLVLYDLHGTVVERWPTQFLRHQSRAGDSSRSNLAAADAEGVWLTTLDQVFRLRRPAGS